MASLAPSSPCVWRPRTSGQPCLVSSSAATSPALPLARCAASGSSSEFGHIRAYAAFAGLVVAATALMPLRVGPLPWLTLRAAVGFGCAGLFVATESWLNAKAEPAQRGRVFSGYMFGTFVALALGQLLISWAKIETAGPFNAIVALFAAALVLVEHARAGTASRDRLGGPAFWSTLPGGAPGRGRLPDGRACERRLLRSRSSLDARRRHRTRHDCEYSCSWRCWAGSHSKFR